LDEAFILARTKEAVATSVLVANSEGLDAVGFPVRDALTIVLFVKVSVPAKVAIVPVVGKVILPHSNSPLFQDKTLSVEAVALSKIVGKTISFIETVP
jgi:hypothetical protein